MYVVGSSTGAALPSSDKVHLPKLPRHLSSSGSKAREYQAEHILRRHERRRRAFFSLHKALLSRYARNTIGIPGVGFEASLLQSGQFIQFFTRIVLTARSDICRIMLASSLLGASQIAPPSSRQENANLRTVRIPKVPSLCQQRPSHNRH